MRLIQPSVLASRGKPSARGGGRRYERCGRECEGGRLTVNLVGLVVLAVVMVAAAE